MTMKLGEIYQTTEGGNVHTYSMRCSEEDWLKMAAAPELTRACSVAIQLLQDRFGDFDSEAGEVIGCIHTALVKAGLRK